MSSQTVPTKKISFYQLESPVQEQNNSSTNQIIPGAAQSRRHSTNEIIGSDQGPFRRLSKASTIDNDVDSHASNDSNQTEEDVWLPLDQERVRVKGVDYGLIEEFIKNSKEEDAVINPQRDIGPNHTVPVDEGGNPITSILSSGNNRNSAKVKPKFKLRNPYKIFKKMNKKDGHDDINSISSADSGSINSVKFGSTRIQQDSPPDRFSFFSSDSDETIHTSNIPSLCEESGKTVRELFGSSDSPWWLDCSCPTDAEMKMLTKAFNIHPLTSEDIRMQETREKFELFKDYYFICIHSFNPDEESEDFLEPINVYAVVFKEGMLTFHSTPLSHPANVRRRVRQLKDYIHITADWLCYAMIDDITDSFAPFISEIEFDSDLIEDSVLISRGLDFSNMLQKIGESRRKSMALMRLLSGKADVVKIFAKRCQDVDSETSYQQSNSEFFNPTSSNQPSSSDPQSYFSNKNGVNSSHRVQPRAEIALYLGDIQDHVVTMHQNLLAHEKILGRSHANYLAQLQVESFNSNNMVTDMLSKVTLIGTMFVPLNLVTGLFGMNVKVPGKTVGNLHWFFWIIGLMGIAIIVCLVFGNMWLKKSQLSAAPNGESSKLSIRNIAFKARKPFISQKSTVSFTSKYNRYEV